MIEPGERAPDFTVPNQDGEPVTLSELRGRHVVLYFYPTADTPGCTKQACGERDRSKEYEAAAAVVLGISPDPVEDLRAFADKYGLAFTLLADGARRWRSAMASGRATSSEAPF
jgi:peroxiredoxin Q/BCP